MKREHTFRQSWLKTAATCPERARRELCGSLPPRETDAAAVGTAVHAGIEGFLRGEFESFGDAREVAHSTFEQIEQDPSFTWTKYSHRTSSNLIDTFLGHWWGIRDQFQPLEVEYNFKKKFYEDDERIIYLSGTIDLIDQRMGLVDWKTSGRGPYETWEYDRWAIQPTVYTWAWHGTEHEQFPFTYNVMHKDGIQTFTVWRSPADWEWLRLRTLQYAEMIEADMLQWPMHDNHALCSAKWCPAWDTCKGAHY